MALTDKPKKAKKCQLTMFDIFDQPSESTDSSSRVKKRPGQPPAEWPENCIDVDDSDDSSESSQLIDETSDLNRWRDQVQEQEVSIISDCEELDYTETNTTSSTSSSQTTQSTASSEASGCSNVVAEDIAISPTTSPVQPRYINFPTIYSWLFKMMLCFVIPVVCLHVAKEKQRRLSVNLVTEIGSMQEKH